MAPRDCNHFKLNIDGFSRLTAPPGESRVLHRWPIAPVGEPNPEAGRGCAEHDKSQDSVKRMRIGTLGGANSRDR